MKVDKSKKFLSVNGKMTNTVSNISEDEPVKKAKQNDSNKLLYKDAPFDTIVVQVLVDVGFLEKDVDGM